MTEPKAKEPAKVVFSLTMSETQFARFLKTASPEELEEARGTCKHMGRAAKIAGQDEEAFRLGRRAHQCKLAKLGNG